MEEQLPNGTGASNGDVEMKEDAPAPMNETLPLEFAPVPAAEDAPSTPTAPAQATPLAHVSAPTPPAVTPSARPSSIPPTSAGARPDKPIAHGGPTRKYLNQNVTPFLLEGMKYLAAHEPEKPLLWLSEFLRDRSREVEG